MRQVHEIVRLSRSVSDIPVGTAGVIMLLPDGTTSFLVEFPDPSGKEIKLVSVCEDDLIEEEVVITSEDRRLWSIGWQVEND